MRVVKKKITEVFKRNTILHVARICADVKFLVHQCLDFKNLKSLMIFLTAQHRGLRRVFSPCYMYLNMWTLFSDIV